MRKADIPKGGAGMQGAFLCRIPILSGKKSSLTLSLLSLQSFLLLSSKDTGVVVSF